MPVGFSSPARNLFLLASTAGGTLANFFKTLDQSSGTDVNFEPTEIRSIASDETYTLAGEADNSSGDRFGWFENVDYTGSENWSNTIQSSTAGTDTTLRTLEIDGAGNYLVAGKTGTHPWIAKYSSTGVLSWNSTTFSGDVEYTGIAVDSNNVYYACGSTPSFGNNIGLAFVEKFSNTGTPDWGKSSILLNGDVSLSKIAANSRGEVVAVGWLDEGTENAKGYIVKIDTTTGDVMWDRSIKSYGYDNGEHVYCEDVTIDDEDNIYIVGRLVRVSGSTPRGFVARYSPEGNLIWQKETPFGEDFEYYQVKIDNTTKQLITYGRYIDSLNQQYGILTKYESIGDQIWRRKMYVSNTAVFGQTGRGGAVNLDASTQWYYMLYIDMNNADKYTFGRVSSSGNGLGAFQYAEGTGETVYYEILNIDDRVGRLQDGSVRNDVSDLVSYPFTANKLMFDDLATPITNKKVQVAEPNEFDYSGSPAIRTSDFNDINLLGNVYSGSGDWLDQSGKGNNGVTTLTVTTTAEEPFSSAGSIEFDGTGDCLTVADNASFEFGSGNFTIEAFIYFTGSPGTSNNSYAICSKWDNQSAPSDKGFIFRVEDDGNGSNLQWFYTTDGSTNQITTGSTVLSPNTWYHVAFVRNGTTGTFYIDGTADATTVNFGTDSIRDTGNPFRIGANLDIGIVAQEWVGNISNLRIVKGAALYTSNFTPPSSSLPVTTPGGKDWTADGSWTWSNGSASNITNRQRLFDGDITSGSPGAPSGNPGQVRYTFSPALTGYSQVRIRTNTHDDSFALRRVVYNGTSGSNTISTGSNTTQWVDITSNLGGTLNWVEWGNYGGSDSNRSPSGLLGIEVDGTLLVDNLNATELLTAQGSSISDASANSYSITVNGNAAAAQGGTTSNTTAHNAGGWFDFDGVDDTIDLGTTSLIAPSSSFSIEAWCWVDSLTQECSIYEITANGNSGTILLSAGSTTDGNVGGRFLVRNSSGQDQGVRDVVNNNTGEWHHYVGVHINNGIYSSTTLYVDGVGTLTEEVIDTTHPFDFTNVSKQHLGVSSGNRYLDGRIAEFRIYPRALTAGQVFQNYNASKETYTGVAASTDPGLTSTRTP